MDKIVSHVEFVTNYETAFRRHYQLHYHDTGRPYEAYEPAYCVGYELVTIHRLGGRTWDEVERRAQRLWNKQGSDLSWEEVRGAVEHGWNEAREGVGLQDIDDYDEDVDDSYEELVAYDDEVFRIHHEAAYTSGRPYEYFEAAYHFGYELAYKRRYRDRPWEEIEPDVQRQWERTGHDTPWDEVKGAVHHAWREVQKAFALQER